METNPDIINGDCYIGPDTEAISDFIPCGNALYGHRSCCAGGDVCLNSRACFNSRHRLTYLSGCSDPDYRDPSCPDKVFDDAQWVGLSYCNGTSNEWVACKQERNEATLAEPDYCYCSATDAANFAFSAPQDIGATAWLPLRKGQSITWTNGYTPTITTTLTSLFPTSSPSPSSAASSSQSQNSSSSSATSGPTLTPEPDQQQGGGLSSGAKIGLGVGVGIGGTLVVLGLLILFLRYRRKRLAEGDSEDGKPSEPVEPKLPGGLPGTPGTPATTAPSELEPTAARPWSLRSELDTTTPISINEQPQPSPQSGYSESHPNAYPGQPAPYRHSPVANPGAQAPLRTIAELPG